MTKFNNEFCELNDNELDLVGGAFGIGDACGVAQAIGAAMGAIGGINSVLGKAVDGIPPASCHPK